MTRFWVPHQTFWLDAILSFCVLSFSQARQPLRRVAQLPLQSPSQTLRPGRR